MAYLDHYTSYSSQSLIYAFIAYIAHMAHKPYITHKVLMIKKELSLCHELKCLFSLSFHWDSVNKNMSVWQNTQFLLSSEYEFNLSYFKKNVENIFVICLLPGNQV